MNTLQAGFARVDVTPSMGCGIYGYYIPRSVEGVLDPLYARCLVLEASGTKVAMISVDAGGVKRFVLDPIRQEIAKVTGIPAEAIFIHSTHSHTSPYVDPDSEDPLVREYHTLYSRRLLDVAKMANDDLKPARMGFAIGQAPNIAFVRRFRMKDGSVKTNPGVDNPDIVAPIGDVDERVNVLRFDRENDTIVLMNFGDHPDTVGGCKISADWPGLASATLEQAIPGVKAMLFNGAQGDVNHVNVHPRGGYLNDMVNDFDDVTRGYGHARFMARVVAGGVMQVYDKVQYVDVDSLRYGQNLIRVPSNMPDPKDLPEAHRINDLHNAGKDDQLPYEGMMLTTIVAEAARMVRLENGPDSFEMLISGIAIGNVALVGLPGEPFTGIGRGLKETEGWDLVLPMCMINASEGYFPMQEAYDEGGYESRSSNFKAGVAELLIAEGQKLMAQLKN